MRDLGSVGYAPTAEPTTAKIEHMSLFTIRVEYHFEDAPDVRRRLDLLERKVSAMHDEFKAAVTRLEKATTTVGARLDKLASQIEGGLSAAEAAPIVAELTALGDKLEAMGKDPANPDPEPMPDPA